MTLNRVINSLKAAILSHKQVRHFYFGDAGEWNALADKLYPAALLTINATRLIATGGVEYDMSLYLSDVVNDAAEDINEASDANCLEVQSDMLSVLNDVHAELLAYEYDWLLRGDLAVELYDRAPTGDDVVGGVKGDFTLWVPMDKNRCAIPKD